MVQCLSLYTVKLVFPAACKKSAGSQWRRHTRCIGFVHLTEHVFLCGRFKMSDEVVLQGDFSALWNQLELRLMLWLGLGLTLTVTVTLNKALEFPAAHILSRPMFCGVSELWGNRGILNASKVRTIWCFVIPHLHIRACDWSKSRHMAVTESR